MSKRLFTMGRAAASTMASMVALAALAMPAAAQELVLEEIIVTAQKRSENLQEVPISVGTISGDDLQFLAAGGSDIRFLSGRVPSVYAESSFGRVFPRFYIRGLGNIDFDLNSTQPVGLVYDEVVQENPLLRGFPAFDLERVEVLRGPQGTLFGRNTPAGTVAFVSKKPKMTPDGYANLSYGRWNALELEGAVGGPLVADKLAARMSVQYQRRDDWVDNTFNGAGDDLEGYTDFAGRVQLLYDAGTPFTALLNAHLRDLDGTARVFRANAIRRGSNDLVAGFDRFSVRQDGPNEQDARTWGVNAKLEYDFDGVLLTSITGYETVDIYTRGDIDGGVNLDPARNFTPAGAASDGIPFSSETADEIKDQYQFSQEFRLSQSLDTFNWQTGLFYFYEEVGANLYNYERDFPPAGALSGSTSAKQENRTWAVFGQASYNITDPLKLTAGIRYSKDEKDYAVTRNGFFLDSRPITGRRETDDSEVTWDLSATYAATDDVNLYARVAKGFRAPAIQGRVLFVFTPNSVEGGLSTAKSETILSYEAGVKSDLWDNRARLNVSAFTYTIDDQQFTAVGGAGNTNILVNADQGEGYGFESELELVPAANVLLTAGLSYNSTEIKDKRLSVAPCGGGCTVRDPLTAGGNALLDGNSFPNAPEWIGTLTGRYGIPLDDGSEIYLHSDWSYRSKVQFTLYESVEFTSDAKWDGGARVGWISSDGRYEASAFVRNLTDEVSLEGGIDFNNLTGFINEPRTWGVEFGVKF